MKTTVKTTYTGQAVIEPLKFQKMVMLTTRDAHGQTVFIELTPEQAGVLSFGIDRALEAIGCEVTS